MQTSRNQTLGEEIANSISHGLGFLAGIVVLPFLVTSAWSGGIFPVVGAAVFCFMIILLYGCSALYHALPARAAKAKRLLNKLDHASIYLLIAGSYTPFLLSVLRNSLGWTLFGIVWAIAICGVTLKCAGKIRHPWISTGLYLGMGWLIVFAIVPLFQALPLGGSLLLVLGGVCYSGGVFYYHNEKPYAHFVWHLFVVAGTACHVAAVWLMLNHTNLIT